MLIVNTYFMIVLKGENKDGLALAFNPMNFGFDELDAFNSKLTWFLLASILLTIVFIIAQFKIY